MQSDNEFQSLRSLAATDPRRAKEMIGTLLDSNSPYLETVLQRASSPGDGRLRQMFANLVRVRGEQLKFAAQLMAWREVEADEFARRAIDAALQGTDRPERETQKRPSLVERGQVEAYRYVSERLKHRLRNVMMAPLGDLIRLRGLLDAVADESVRGTLSARIAALDDALTQIGRVVEFDPGDGHFDIRIITLGQWLESFNDEYARTFRPVDLRLERRDRDCRVTASDYLLGTVFWNLWINSQQAVGRGCTITAHLSESSGRVNLLLVDNGDGFPKEFGETGLLDVKPRQGHRGRGLLEVQEAMDRLHGEASIICYSDGSFRIKLSFPRES